MHRLIRAQPHDPWKAYRVARVVPVASLDLVEGDLDDRVGPDDARAPEVLDRRRQEVLGHLRDLLIGETRVRLADDAQAVAVLHRERVVGEDAVALPVAPLDRRDDPAERAQRPPHLEPPHPAPTRPGWAPRAPDHQAFGPPPARRAD